MEFHLLHVCAQNMTQSPNQHFFGQSKKRKANNTLQRVWPTAVIYDAFMPLYNRSGKTSSKLTMEPFNGSGTFPTDLDFGGMFNKPDLTVQVSIWYNLQLNVQNTFLLSWTGFHSYGNNILRIALIHSFRPFFFLRGDGSLDKYRF